MSHYDVNKRNNLGKIRKKSTGVLILVDLLAIVFFYVISRFADKLSLNAENVVNFRVFCYACIFVLILLLFVLLVVLTRPSYILQNDLNNIYIVKKYNKVTTIPVIELKKVRARVRSSKKAKRQYGTLIIITTTKKRYKIKNIYNVTDVKKEIMAIIEKLKIYFEGVKHGSKYNQGPTIYE